MKKNKAGKTIHSYTVRQLRNKLDKAGIQYIARNALRVDPKSVRWTEDGPISKKIRYYRGAYAYKTYLWDLCLKNKV